MNRRSIFGLPLVLLGWRRGASADPAKLVVGPDFGRVPSMAEFDSSVSYSYADLVKVHNVRKLEIVEYFDGLPVYDISRADNEYEGMVIGDVRYVRGVTGAIARLELTFQGIKIDVVRGPSQAIFDANMRA